MLLTDEQRKDLTKYVAELYCKGALFTPSGEDYVPYEDDGFECPEVAVPDGMDEDEFGEGLDREVTDVCDNVRDRVRSFFANEFGIDPTAL